MAREINLETPKSITLVTKEEKVISVDKISINTVTDDGFSVYANISFDIDHGYIKTIILWTGQDYINIGQWTDSDVDNRVKQILNIL